MVTIRHFCGTIRLCERDKTRPAATGSLHQPPGESNTHRHQQQTNDEFGRKSVPSLSGRFDCGTLTLFTGPTQAPPLPVMAPPCCRWISGTLQTGKKKLGWILSYHRPGFIHFRDDRLPKKPKP
jgi:hypothetical protein